MWDLSKVELKTTKYADIIWGVWWGFSLEVIWHPNQPCNDATWLEERLYLQQSYKARLYFSSVLIYLSEQSRTSAVVVDAVDKWPVFGRRCNGGRHFADPSMVLARGDSYGKNDDLLNKTYFLFNREQPSGVHYYLRCAHCCAKRDAVTKPIWRYARNRFGVRPTVKWPAEYSVLSTRANATARDGGNLWWKNNNSVIIIKKNKYIATCRGIIIRCYGLLVIGRIFFWWRVI